MASPQSPNTPKGPPYLPTTWSLGGSQEKGVDVPITSVFLLLFISGAATNMTIFQLNQRKGHKFLFSAMLFGFSMARVVTCILRIASACLPTNINLAIANQVFVAAGVVVLFIVNLVFSLRIIRATHPKIGWHRFCTAGFDFLYALVVMTIIMLIAVTVQSFFTLNRNTRRIDRDIQLYGVTCFAVLSFLPIPLVLGALALPRKKGQAFDSFGQGRWRTKVAILLTGATLLCFGAAYRAGTSWMPLVPRSRPLPIYFHRAAFYIVNFTVEVLVLYLYAFARVDQRFHVHDGAMVRKSYAKPEDFSPGDVGEKVVDEEAGVPKTSKSEETLHNHETLVDDQKISNEGSGGNVVDKGVLTREG